MSKLISLLILISIISCNSNMETQSNKEIQKPAEYAIIIHGGAGYTPSDISEEKKAEYFKMLEDALNLGEQILKDGGSSLDAVEQTISFMEDIPFFNAGKGAVFTHEGKNELDASIMDGSTMKAGAIGGVTNVKNPIKGARAVMEKSQHVLLTQKGAEEFCKDNGIETISPDYFHTKTKWDRLQNAIKDEDKEQGLHIDLKLNDNKFGTVGCAALDKNGNLAAGTSTGGMTNKRWNRIGDSPIIGAGTYANNATCAVSCTGHGEYFIRYAVAHDLSARMKYGKQKLDEAANDIVMNELKSVGGNGGLIAVDKYGNFAYPYNTGSMFRAYAKPGIRKLDIWADK